MNSTTFAAVPVMQCHFPAKTFTRAEDALRYAENAARQLGMSYAVWQRHNGRLKRLQTFTAK